MNAKHFGHLKIYLKIYFRFHLAVKNYILGLRYHLENKLNTALFREKKNMNLTLVNLDMFSFQMQIISKNI